MNKSPRITIDEDQGCATGCGGGIVGMVGGGVVMPIAGYFELGFGLGLLATVPAVLIGGAAGLVGGLVVGYKLGVRSEDKHKRLNREALDDNARYVTIAYQGDAVNCILRPDYTRGHTFDIETADDVTANMELYFHPKKGMEFEVVVAESANKIPEHEYEIKIQEAIGGLSGIEGGAERIKGCLVGKATLETRVLNPDDITNISTAATKLLEVTSEISRRYKHGQ